MFSKKFTISRATHEILELDLQGERGVFRCLLGDRRESKLYSLKHRGQNFERLQD